MSRIHLDNDFDVKLVQSCFETGTALKCLGFIQM